MKGKYINLFFYLAIALVVSTTIAHIYVDPPNSYLDNITLMMLLCSIGVLIWMTILQRMERAHYKEKSTLLETVITSANDGIIITKSTLDAPGPEIIYVNESFSRISGYSASEMIGKSPKVLQGAFTKRETLDEIRRCLSSGMPFKGELLNYHKNGQTYWLDISIMPVKDSSGNITHFAAIERDISDRKQAEIQHKNILIQLQRANLKAEATSRDLHESLLKAEEANKAKSDFLANMSHELRTPMNGVLGMAHLLADTSLTNEQAEFVSTINSSGESLLMLLNDILDFSKIEAGALELENVPLDIIETIHKTTDLLAVNAARKNIALLVDCADSIPQFIMGDSGRIKQIIINLLGNAIKFTNHGYVRISAQVVEIKGAAYLQMRVEDTGSGIPSDKQEEIFNKFTQADASITRKYGGTGLGLAITKQLVGLMHGNIGVESVEGKGSTFWFNIPCVIADFCDITSLVNPVINMAAKPKRKNITEVKALLVEDHPVNQIFAQKLLNKFGLNNIDYAENGIEAINKIRMNTYDVIFMDCQMPEMDGYQATRAIRADYDNISAPVPIIAMTANAMMGDREKCLKAGMDDYISKPLRAEHLRTILNNLFHMEEQNKIHASTARKSAPSTLEPPIDMEQLRMFTDGDPQEEKALIELFLEQGHELIAIMQDCIDSGNATEWKSAAHRFKGSSGNLGASKLLHHCKNAETNYEYGSIQKSEILTAIKSEMRRIESVLTEYAN